jgi:hypothetical protein
MELISNLSGMHPWKHKGRYVQMQQSEKPDLGPGFLSVSLDAAGALAVASDLSCRNALVLTAMTIRQTRQFPLFDSEISHVLERISGSLPLATYLDTNTNAFIDVFCATLIVDAELESVTVFELKWAGVLVGR